MSPFSRPVLVRRSTSLVTLAALSWAAVASAAPAVITRSTVARSAPFNVAPAVETLQSGTKLEADQAPTSDGWRRVQLANGNFVFVRDSDVEVDLSHVAKAPAHPAETHSPAPAPAAAASPAEPIEPLVAAPAEPGGLPLQYVGTFSHLAALVKSDPEVFELADGIATRRAAASVFVWGGAFGGIVLAALGSWAEAHNAFTTRANATLISAGATIFFLGPLIGAAIWPLHDDQTAVVNMWNARHPDRPFVDHAGVEVPR